MKKSGTLVAIAFLSASFLASPVMAAETAGVMMKDGKMMMMKDGKATEPMAQDVTMTNGQKVAADGTITTTTHMKEGQMMTMDGKMKMGGKTGMKMEGMKKEGMGMGMGMDMKKEGMGRGMDMKKEGMGK